MATATKRHIIVRLSDRLGITQQQSSEFVEAFLETVEDAVTAGDEVTFRTFGSFALKVNKSKIGRNPSQPDVSVTIPPRCVVRFRPSRELKARVATLPVERVQMTKPRRGRPPRQRVDSEG